MRTPRSWQIEALKRWEASNHRGIVSVVTGGGKTIFALSCVAKLRPLVTLVVVPTAALLDQWWNEIAAYFDLPLDEVNVISGSGKLQLGTINLAVINTAAKHSQSLANQGCFLIVDECHRAASPQFRRVLEIPTSASLGLSATPERPYDEGLSEVLIPALGEVIFNYDYASALSDGVIIPFTLHNVVFDLEPDTQSDYDAITRSIARSIDQTGLDSPETVALFLKRARILNLSLNRVRLTLKLIAGNKGRKILVFHEDIDACILIARILGENNIRADTYHSKMSLRERAGVLAKYQSGAIDVLVTCKALDEGFNVPDTEIGIIAASTATRRQRIQRLGRIVRPAKGKLSAEIYTLVATNPEIARLKSEESELEGVASVTWSHA